MNRCIPCFFFGVWAYECVHIFYILLADNWILYEALLLSVALWHYRILVPRSKKDRLIAEIAVEKNNGESTFFVSRGAKRHFLLYKQLHAARSVGWRHAQNFLTCQNLVLAPYTVHSAQRSCKDTRANKTRLEKPNLERGGLWALARITPGNYQPIIKEWRRWLPSHRTPGPLCAGDSRA